MEGMFHIDLMLEWKNRKRKRKKKTMLLLQMFFLYKSLVRKELGAATMESKSSWSMNARVLTLVEQYHKDC